MLLITEADVEMLLAIMKLDTSPCPDQIYPRLSSECSSTMVVPITIIFRNSISESLVHKSSKDAKVIPIFKKGKSLVYMVEVGHNC